MNQIIATAQQILDFKVGAISVGSVIQGLILLIIFNRIISMIMGPLIDKILDRFKLETTVRGFVKALVKVILNFVALCVVAESIGIPIASVLAVVGMLGLAISLSVQGALSNVSNGFLILVTKPFKVGDYVAIAGIEGFVKEVSMLCTKVLTIELRRVDIETKAGYANKFEDVYAAVLQAVKDTPTALQDPAPFVRVSGYTDYAVVYTIRVWTKSANYWDCYFDLMQKVGEFKDKNGIVGGVPSMRYISDK